MSKITRIFSPDRPGARRRYFYRLLTLGLIGIILVLVGLIINKYLKTPFLVNLTSQLKPKQNEVEAPIVSQIVAAIDPLYFKVFEAIPDERGDVIVKSEDGIVAYFSKDKDISEQVYSLQTILLKARIDTKRIKKIDLRFDKVYAEYAQ